MARPIAPDHADKRAALLRAAAQLFAAQGFAATGIAQLAAASAGSKARLYHYFPTKQALLQALLAEHLHALTEALQQVHAQADQLNLDGEARLALLIHRMIVLGARQADAAAVLRHELRQLDPAAQDALAPQIARLEHLLDRAISSAAPTLDAAELPAMRAALRGLIDAPRSATLGTHAKAQPDAPLNDAARYAKQAAGLFVHGLRGMLAASLHTDRAR
jgi:AcrR family transcriptional regulator